MNWLSGLARDLGPRRQLAASPRRHPGLWHDRTLEPGCELLFLNFNALMGVLADGRVQRVPQLSHLLSQRSALRVVLVTDAQRCESYYRSLLAQLPEAVACRIVGIATTAAAPTARFEAACVRYASDFEASAFVAIDSLSRGYSVRCPFLVLTSSSGLDDSAVERTVRILSMQQRDAEEFDQPSLREQLRAEVRQVNRGFRRAALAVAATISS